MHTDDGSGSGSGSGNGGSGNGNQRRRLVRRQSGDAQGLLGGRQDDGSGAAAPAPFDAVAASLGSEGI